MTAKPPAMPAVGQGKFSTTVTVVPAPPPPAQPAIPPAKELPGAPPPTRGERIPIPTSWWIAILVLLIALAVFMTYLAFHGTNLEVDALVAYSNTVIAVAALFSIYLSSRGRAGRQE